MGKFNTYGSFFRTRDDIIRDYTDYLIKIEVIKAEEREIYLTEKTEEIESILLEKCYDREKHRGVYVSSKLAFWTFCNFIICRDYITNQRVWNKFVSDLFNVVEMNTNSCIMASRGIGKSYFYFVLYPAFKMFLYPHTRFLIVSNIPQQCISNLRLLKQTLDLNETLSQKKEISKGKDLKWTEREIEYNKGYLLTISAGTSPRGQHPHYCFGDDIIVESSYSDEEMENYILGQLIPCVQRSGGRLCVSGTPQHLKDLYHSLMNEKDNFGGKLISHGAMSAKGFYSKTFPIINDKNEIYLPEVFSHQKLKQVRQTQGELKFQREYLLCCTDKSATLFPESLINRIVDTEYDYWYAPPEEEDKMGVYVTGVDTATSGEASADSSAFITLQIKETNKGIIKILRNIVHEKGMAISGTIDKESGEYLNIGQVETIQNISTIFNNSFTVVEKNNVGVAHIQELEKRNVNLSHIVTDKPKKEGMIRYLISEMQSGNLIIPGKTRIEEIEKLKKELLNFGVKRTKHGKEKMEALSGHDDLVIALAIANDAARNMSSLPFALCQD